jgi:hypothetical protein
MDKSFVSLRVALVALCGEEKIYFTAKGLRQAQADAKDSQRITKGRSYK